MVVSVWVPSWEETWHKEQFQWPVPELLSQNPRCQPSHCNLQTDEREKRKRMGQRRREGRKWREEWREEWRRKGGEDGEEKKRGREERGEQEERGGECRL